MSDAVQQVATVETTLDDSSVKSTTLLTNPRAPIEVSEEVRTAIEEGLPVVALESTIIAHGLPYPDNLTIARELDAAVRDQGAVPATIAVIRGRLCVGLSDDDLSTIATDKQNVAKAGVTDLAVHMTNKSTAATTVSATAWLAHQAGIRVFATGGIGGVHRRTSYSDVNDVSSDLSTLSALPIAVVSAGPKAILDIPATCEALESLGVLVVGYQTRHMPAFYTRSSGVELEHSVDDADQLSRLIHNRFDQLGQNGILVAAPIPADAALDADEVNTWIAAALAEADSQGVGGKQLTPFLLDQLAKRSDGRAVTANRALALNNARVGGQVRQVKASEITS